MDPLNFSVFPILRPVPVAYAQGALFAINSSSLQTRYIQRIVFDNNAIQYGVDLLPNAPWDGQTCTLRWQVLVGNPDDRASLLQFGLFADQGSVEFASPIQIQPRNTTYVTILDVKPTSIQKLNVIIHLAGYA